MVFTVKVKSFWCLTHQGVCPFYEEGKFWVCSKCGAEAYEKDGQWVGVA